MKKFASLTILLIGVFLVSNQLVFAGGKGRKVEFPRDVIIDGKEVKKGKYKLQFDEQTSEIVILKGNNVIAKSKARKQPRNKNYEAIISEMLIVKQAEKSFVKRITLAGEREDILLDVKTVNASPQ
ncbi:MAG: hypothetical protein HY819_15835 [Acidobacteria bacterium]|nr:hypothetical protein [Acidobacteriota bacterium]